MEKPFCSVPECLDRSRIKGLCDKHYQKQWYAARRAEHGAKVAAARELRRRSPEYLQRQKERDKLRVPTRLKAEGITQTEYLEWRKIEACQICGRVDEDKRLAVDHCHARKKIRGVLCQNCNQGLGKFKDSPTLLEAAAQYLRKAGHE